MGLLEWVHVCGDVVPRVDSHKKGSSGEEAFKSEMGNLTMDINHL